MTVKEMISSLKKLPQDLELVYSRDDEGNGFQKVYNAPIIGKFDGDDFVGEDHWACDDDYYKGFEGKKVVCIN